MIACFRLLGWVGCASLALLAPAVATPAPAPAEAPATAPAAAPLAVERLALVRVVGDPSFRHAGEITAIALRHGGEQIVTSSRDGTVRVWDNQGKELRRLAPDAKHEDVWCVQVLPDQKQAVSCGGDGRVTLWDLDTGAAVRRYAHHEKTTVFRLAVAPDGKQVVAGDAKNVAILWDLTSGQKLRTFTGHAGSVYGVALSPDGKTLLTGSDDKTVRVWDVASGDCRQALPGLGHSVHTVAFDPQGRSFACAAGDKLVRLWNAADLSERWTATLENGPAVVSFTPDGRHVLAAANGAGPLHVLKAADGVAEPPVPLPGGSHWPSLALPGGREVLVDAQGLLMRWELGAKRRLFPAGAADAPVMIGAPRDLVVDAAGRQALVCSDSGHVFVWDLEGGACVRSWDTGRRYGNQRFSPDGRRFLSEADNNVHRIFATATGTVERELKLPEGFWGARWAWAGPTTLVMLGRGNLGDGQNTDDTGGVFEVWDALTGTRRAGTPAPRDQDDEVAVSRDGRRAAAMVKQTQVYVWDVASGQELGRVEVAAKRVDKVHWLADGRTLLLAEQVSDDQRQLSQWGTAQPAAAAVPAEAAQWVKELGAEAFEVREAAVQKLIAVGPAVEAALAQADLKDAEVNERVGMVRRGLGRRTLPVNATGTALGLDQAVTGLCAHPDGRHFAMVVGGAADTRILLAAATPAGPKVLRQVPDPHGPACLWWSADGKTLYTANRNATFGVYRVQ